MKILKLKSKNINSLKGEFSIDFTSFLNNNALFAITGPTGAGKSTILDIITCALYGRTARLKNPNELMARHTGECFCEVEFEIRGDIYRSSWTQKRARKSFDGKFQTAKMELSDVNKSKVLKSTLRDVPKYVEELSGLDFDRFVQSMMLAQGSFDAFLKAKEADRSTLLEKITGTQIYAKISKEIYDTYVSNKTDIDSDKKVLDNAELLETVEVEEQTKLLDENKKEKEVFDKKEKELIDIKIWIETFNKLKKETYEYEELFQKISQEKEDKKEEFNKLDLANKALNVQSTYDKKKSIEQTIQKDDTKNKQLLLDIEKLKEQLLKSESEYETVQQDTKRVKKEFDDNSIKVKEVRVLQTQINVKEKHLNDIQDNISFKTELKNKYQKIIDDSKIEYLKIENKINSSKEYIETHKKDEKLLESLNSIQKEIQEYEKEKSTLSNIKDEKKQLDINESTIKSSHKILDDEVKNLNKILDSKINDYKLMEKNSSKDMIDEPQYREKLNTFNTLLKEYNQYQELNKKIQNQEQEKLSNEKENSFLKESLNAKKTILHELKTHIDTLKEKREHELLIVKYEDDREKIKEGDECFLCGSTSHPYITQHNTIDIDTTNITIDEKEVLYKTNEDELLELNNKQIQISTKLETNRLELLKLNEFYEEKIEVFKKASIILDEETLIKLEEQILFFEKTLNDIVNRREEKDKLLKEKELAQENYTKQQTLFLQSQKELEKINLLQEQNTKNETNTFHKYKNIISELITLFLKFDMTFDELNYQELLEQLLLRNKTFLENIQNLKNYEEKRNSFDLDNKENETKLLSFKNELVNLEESSVELLSNIVSLKEESLEILNIADINMFELQIKNSFEKVQKIENNLSEELATLQMKIQEYHKQQKTLNDELDKNNTLQKELDINLQRELKNNQFTDIDAFEKAILPKEQREELSQYCKNIEDDYNKFQTLKIDTSNKFLEHKKEIISDKSLEEIKKELQEIKIKSDQLQQNIGEITAVLKRDTEDREKHQEKIQELDKKKEKFKVWVKLNEMIGSADGNKFAKFAQGITLDQLINLANNHLSVLSSRYELQRSTDPKQLLEIEVCDSFQGDVIRPVSTLSGGESFIVSLSLALGLSELASQKIAIDSLFLDEGFGTLDEDSLETALNALNLLQSSGKMVGVISHVEALKERIPLQIKVIPKGDGTSFIQMD